MSEQLKRRASDYNDQREIDRLIAEEQDPKARLQLVIMNRIAGSIQSMESKLTELSDVHTDLRKDYISHKTNQEAMENKGKGVIWTFTILKGLFVAALIFCWNDYQGEKINNKTLHQLEDKRLSDLEQSYTNLWTTIKSPSK